MLDPWIAPFRFGRLAYWSSNPSEEFITIVALIECDLIGCTVVSLSGRAYSFSRSLELSEGQEVTLYSGVGTDTASVFYWNQTAEVWDNHAGSAGLWWDTGSGVAHLLDSWGYGRSP